MKTAPFVVVLVAALVAGFIWIVIDAERHESHQRATATYQDVGKLLDCQPIPVAFNDSPKARVETTRGVFIINRSLSGLKGAKVTLSSDGYLFVEGDPKGYSLAER
jgi:hypothetical protein